MSVQGLCNTTLTWTRRVYPDDGSAATLTALGTLAARVQPGRGTEPLLYGKDTEVRPTNIYTPGSPDVQPQDILTDPAGTVYLVRSVADVDLLGSHTQIVAEVQR